MKPKKIKPPIRVPVAPPGHAMPTKKDYDRRNNKIEIERDIEAEIGNGGRVDDDMPDDISP